MKQENTRKSLEAKIIECKKELRDLAPLIDEDDEKSKLYNKIIVQKAILVDRYKKLCYKPSVLQKIKEKIKQNPFKKREKLICDYFLT